MTDEQAEALIAGQKIKYWDGRIATVVTPATETTIPPSTDPVDVITIVFDADADPKPQFFIQCTDFIRAEAL